ncbi:MAG: PDZ domain-containing protein [Planctomycetota bacterium]
MRFALVLSLLALALPLPLSAQDGAEPAAKPAEEKARVARGVGVPGEEGGHRPDRDTQQWLGSERPALPPAIANALDWRSIGPANMGGRITGLAIHPTDASTWWAATASGGLLKTTNDGRGFTHHFDREKTVSIGAIAVAPSDPRVLYVGTGEANPRNSVSWGDGVYRSDDGGETWKNLGLRASFQIGAIAVHPKNPDVVWVGALGRLWGDSDERGLYRSTDGGKTWQRTLFVDQQTGVIDIDLHPEDPDTLLVATYQRQRDGFDTNHPALRYGEGSGLWRSTDGGVTFTRVTAGLPSVKLGRLGLDWSHSEPDTVFTLVETESIGGIPEDTAYAGVTGENADVGAKVTRVVDDGPAAKAGLAVGDIVVSIDGHTVQGQDDLVRQFRRRKAGERAKLEISRDRKRLEFEIEFARQPEREGREAEAARFPFRAYLSGQRENVTDQQGEAGHEYGGTFRSDDAGLTWRRVNSLNPRPMYFSEIRVDPSDAKRLYVLGVQLHRSEDGGETFTNDGHGGDVHVDHHALWIDPSDGRHIILGNDGGIYVTRDRMKTWDHLNHVAIGQFYHVGVGPKLDYHVYGGLQDNGSWSGPSRSRDGAILDADWFRIGGGDGFVCRVDPEDPGQIYFESQNGGMGRRHLENGERGGIRPPRPPRGEGREATSHRFNWRTPFVLSAHNSRIYYAAGERVFRSLDRGEGLRAISPEISRTDRGAATALAESPREENELWVGTDDGGFWMTRDGGATWRDLFALPPAKAPSDPAAEAAGEGDRAPGERGRRRGGRRGNPRARLAAMDANGDGVVARDEVDERMRAFFDRLDEDGDGRVEIAPAASEAPPAVPAAAVAADEDPVTGTWAGDAKREGGDPNPFSLQLRRDAAGEIRGRYDGFGEGEVTGGKYDAETRRLTLTIETERFGLDVTATVDGEAMEGTLAFSEGDFSLSFRAERRSKEGPPPAEAAAPAGDGKPLRDHLPEPLHVSEIVASRFADGRAYVTFDGHRSDYDEPFVFATEDHGETWRALHTGLPADAGSARCIVEDLVNENLLFLGCEFGGWVSIDRGVTWTRLGGEFPTVAVHGFALHPLAEEVVVATHGRSLWIADVSALRRMTPERLAERAHMFPTKPATIWRGGMERGASVRAFRGESGPSGAVIRYHLASEAAEVELQILSADGKTVRRLEAPAAAGLHRVSWDLREEAPARRGRRRGRGPRVDTGTYGVRLVVDGEAHTGLLRVQIDPAHPDERWVAAEEREEELMNSEEEEEGGEERDRELDH